MSNSKRHIFTKPEREIVLSKTNGKCAHCGKALTTNTMTVDHVFPMDKGGLDDEYNLLPLCGACNESKSNFVYTLQDYYRHISEEEEPKFQRYNNFATFDYTQKTIIGYDEILFYMLPEEHKVLLSQMAKRKTKKKQIIDMYDKLLVPISLKKAYPGDAEGIYKLIEHNREKYGYDAKLYQSAFDVLIDIKSGVVYILEKNDKICGVFIFRHISQINENIGVSQITNISDHLGLEIKYVMTCALINRFAYGIFDNVMQYLETTQLQNRLMPIYFGILKNFYIDSDDCALIPFSINGVQATLEFLPIKKILSVQKERTKNTFERNDYLDVADEDIEWYAEFSLKHTYQYEFDDDEEAQDFFKKYPKLKDYFKPNTFELYQTGFTSKKE